MDDFQRAVLDLLKDHPGGLLQGRIARELGLKRQGDRRLRRLLLRMQREGSLQRHRGRFLLPGLQARPRPSRHARREAPLPLESPETERARGMEALLDEFELPRRFPDAVLSEAMSQAARDPFARGDRRDLDGLRVFCIDPADARDHDDALSLEPLEGGGRRLGVHIADVAQYVQQGTVLDLEACRRGNSTYFHLDTIPMLPPVLSGDLCSLMEGLARPAMTVFMDFDARGAPLATEICESRVTVSRSFSYEQAEALLDGQGDDAVLMGDLGALAESLRRRRRDEGAVMFELPERVPLEEDGEVTGFGPAPLLRSHRIVEECMLAANRAVCRFMEQKGLRPLYRVHEPPDEEDLLKLRALLERKGIAWKPSRPPRPADFAELSDRLAEEPAEERERLLFSMLRAMKRAAYGPVRAGHFGLAWPDYLHFTSPIRRYSDLYVHRQLKALLRGKKAPRDRDLEELGRSLTESETRSLTAEREGRNLEMALWARRHLGERFTGRVLAVMSGGLLLRLEESGVESFLPASILGREWFDYDEEAERLRGERTGRRFEVGDRLILRIADASYLSRRIHFFLEQDGEEGEDVDAPRSEE